MNEILPRLVPLQNPFRLAGGGFARYLSRGVRPDAEFVQQAAAQLPRRPLGNCLGQNILGMRCPASNRLNASWQVTTYPRRTIRSDQPDQRLHRAIGVHHHGAHGRVQQVQCAWDARHAGARLCQARRAISADQVAAGLRQIPCADVHRDPKRARLSAPTTS